jgi:hypothetical protein
MLDFPPLSAQKTRASMRKAFLLLSAILSGGCAIGQGATENLTPKASKEITVANRNRLDSKFDKMDIDELPPIVPMSPEQSEYVIRITEKMREVLEHRRILEENDEAFGQGAFFWPKDPKKTIKSRLSFEVDNFKFRFIRLGFVRKTAKHPWESAWLTVQPKNFPTGVYDMNLPASFFADMIFLKSYSEKREHESIRNVNVFEFIPRNSSSNTIIRLESRPEVSSVSNKYPRSFHALFIDSNP